jgi:hypothetical protein
MNQGLSYSKFKDLLAFNPNYSTYSSKNLAGVFKVEESLIKDYRERIKLEKKGLLLDNLIEEVTSNTEYIKPIQTTPFIDNIPSEEDLAQTDYRVNNVPQAPPGFIVSSYKTMRGGEIADIWHKRIEGEEISDSTINWDNIIKSLKTEIKPEKLNFKTDGDCEQILCISDVHCGMKAKDWNKEIMFERFKTILSYTKKDSFVTVLFLGDGIDGLGKSTVRGGHTLPQDMNNQEQILNLVKAFQILFDGLAEQVKSGRIKGFDFNSVYESNHSGDMDHVVASFLKMWLEVKYPEVTCDLANEVWAGFEMNGYTIFYTHGKDAHNAKYGLPMNLVDKSELYLCQMLKNYGKELDPRKTIIISGDLHTQAMNQGKFFKYYKVPAMSPSSDWVVANYGYSVPGVQYFVIQDNVLETGIIEF